MSEITWEDLPAPIETERNTDKRDRPENVPDAVVRMAQKAYDGQKRVWQRLPDKEVGKLFLTLIRAAGDHTQKDGKLYPTTVLAQFATKDETGKDLAKSSEGKVVTYIVTERRGQKAKDETQAEGTAASE